MEKVMQLTPDQYVEYRKSKSPKSTLKRIIGIAKKEDYGLGDSVCRIENGELLGIYKEVWIGKTTYYLVVNVLGPELAFAHTLYEKADNN